jgi:hypothetical protein
MSIGADCGDGAMLRPASATSASRSTGSPVGAIWLDSGLGFHLGLRTLDQCGHVVGQIGVGLGLMAKHLIDELTSRACLPPC